MMLVHHADVRHGYANGAESKVGTFSDALMAEAKKKAGPRQYEGRLKQIFAFEK